jgi:hypothetical protein
LKFFFNFSVAGISSILHPEKFPASKLQIGGGPPRLYWGPPGGIRAGKIDKLPDWNYFAKIPGPHLNAFRARITKRMTPEIGILAISSGPRGAQKNGDSSGVNFENPFATNQNSRFFSLLSHDRVLDVPFSDGNFEL